MSKRYFWLKLHRDFFKRHDVMIVENMPNGKDYVLFYLKLLVESIDHEGALRFNDTIPYNENMLSTITHTNVDIVRSALRVFKELKMLELLPDETIHMNAVKAMTGSEVDSAERVRRHRAKQEALPGNMTVTKGNTELELEREKETDRSVHPVDNSGNGRKKGCPHCGKAQPRGYQSSMCMHCHEDMLADGEKKT